MNSYNHATKHWITFVSSFSYVPSAHNHTSDASEDCARNTHLCQTFLLLPTRTVCVCVRSRSCGCSFPVFQEKQKESDGPQLQPEFNKLPVRIVLCFHVLSPVKNTHVIVQPRGVVFVFEAYTNMRWWLRCSVGACSMDAPSEYHCRAILKILLLLSEWCQQLPGLSSANLNTNLSQHMQQLITLSLHPPQKWKQELALRKQAEEQEKASHKGPRRRPSWRDDGIGARFEKVCLFGWLVGCACIVSCVCACMCMCVRAHVAYGVSRKSARG